MKKLTVSMVSKPVKGRAGIWTQGCILSIARILPWVSRECGGATVGEEEMRHLSWVCWVWGTRETSRRRAEFGTWGRSYMKEKEFVSGSYILRLYVEHKSIWLAHWNFQMGILAAHLQGCFLVCVQFARPIFQNCNQGFLVLTRRLLSPPCVPAVLSPLFWRDFASCYPVAGARRCLWELSSIPEPVTPVVGKKNPQSWGELKMVNMRMRKEIVSLRQGDQRGVWQPGKDLGSHVKKRSSVKLLIHPTPSPLSFSDFE